MIDIDRGARPSSLDRGLHDPAFRDHLYQVFQRKCYLTEAPLSRSELEVDHATPRAHNGDDRWENLYPADRRANRAKSDLDPEGGLCLPGDGVEVRLVQSLSTSTYRVECVFEAKDPDDRAAANTARLLRKIHHETNTSRFSDDLREAIARRLSDLQTDIIRYYQARNDADRATHLGHARGKLSRDSPFLALLRSRPEVQRFLADVGLD